MVSKHNIINGLVKFIETDMASANGAATSKFVVLLAKNVIKKNENIIDSLLDNPMVKALLVESDGKYDLTTLMSALCDTATELGCIPLAIPKIPFLLPNGDELRLSVNDINTINRYINEDAEAHEIHEEHMSDSHEHHESNGIPVTTNKVVTNA